MTKALPMLTGGRRHPGYAKKVKYLRPDITLTVTTKQGLRNSQTSSGIGESTIRL